ncbi:MAG: class I SAM-dependent methyltransferase [Acidimicrobiales bacterium]|nr:class I SAM-dependent methyltransferase [Acidimicrobiales bacterium]MCB9392954.1 class I SAM-dependent methyltransferase [Acidimicrobiaceae bacterium]
MLAEIQRRGAIGRGSIDDAVAHADGFVTALPALPPGARLIDLGSGGGLPGLVIASRRPDLQITLVERRHKRADLLAFGVRALDLGDRVRVIADDVTHAAAAGVLDLPAAVVTARSFAAPEVITAMVNRLLGTPGWLLVSEPPSGPSRWPAAMLDQARLRDEGRFGVVRRFVRC